MKLTVIAHVGCLNVKLLSLLTNNELFIIASERALCCKEKLLERGKNFPMKSTTKANLKCAKNSLCSLLLN